MRQIASFASLKHAEVFSDFLSRNNISNQFEKLEGDDPNEYAIWVHAEEDLDRAFDYYETFALHPEHPRFAGVPPKISKPSARTSSKETKKTLGQSLRHSLTYCLIALCALFYLWNDHQEKTFRSSEVLARKLSFVYLTPLQKTFFFDDPKPLEDLETFLETRDIQSYEDLSKSPEPVQRAFVSLKQAPIWQGVFQLALDEVKSDEVPTQGPLFTDIKRGQVWRLITPVFLHRDFLHIFFNMAWLLILGKQVEERLKKGKMIVLIALLAAFSNTCQYLMSGPFFLGFSGVITGLAGFIWARQKKAPWEAYPLQRATALFLFYFVLILFVISVACFILKAFAEADFASSMANTAHISGGLLGLALGRVSWFRRRIA